MRVAVFDLDGTLADTAGDLIAAANAALAEAGHPASLDPLRDRALAVHTRLYDGAEVALERLAAAGWRLGICTNKPERLALLLIEELGLTRHFAALLGADSLPVRKPDPRHLLETIARAGGVPGRSALVGDTVTDRDAARAAGVPCVLVGFGPEGGAVSKLAPEALIAHYDELFDVLERLVPAD